MIRPQFNIRVMLLSTAMFAIALGVFRFLVGLLKATLGPTDARTSAFRAGDGLIAALWFIGWMLLGTAVGVLLNKWRHGAIGGALGGLLFPCLGCLGVF